MSQLCNQKNFFILEKNLLPKVFFKFIYLFYLLIFGRVGSSLLRAGFLQLWRAGSTVCCCAPASHCGGFSCCGAWALGTRASVVVALERRLRSCGAWTLLLCGMWELPGPGLEPVFPELAGGFLTTAPPGKPYYLGFCRFTFNYAVKLFYLKLNLKYSLDILLLRKFLLSLNFHQLDVEKVKYIKWCLQMLTTKHSAPFTYF